MNPGGFDDWPDDLRAELAAGRIAYAERQLWKNTDLAVTLFNSDDIEDDADFLGTGTPPFDSDSVSNADRLRLQVDLKYKFN